MLIEVRSVDKDGFIDDFIIADSENIPEGYISDRPHGLIKPRWTGAEWVEAITQEEIDAMVTEEEDEKSITLEERIAQLEAKNTELENTLNTLFGV